MVICVSANDPFVMHAWGEAQGCIGKIKMLSDMHLELTKALGLVLDATPVLGTHRSRRYAMYVENGIIKNIQVEPQGQLACSLGVNCLIPIRNCLCLTFFSLFLLSPGVPRCPCVRELGCLCSYLYSLFPCAKFADVKS